jgi:hypothetical protein
LLPDVVESIFIPRHDNPAKKLTWWSRIDDLRWANVVVALVYKGLQSGKVINHLRDVLIISERQLNTDGESHRGQSFHSVMIPLNDSEDFNYKLVVPSAMTLVVSEQYTHVAGQAVDAKDPWVTFVCVGVLTLMNKRKLANV